jgi:hypothetical protein
MSILIWFVLPPDSLQPTTEDLGMQKDVLAQQEGYIPCKQDPIFVQADIVGLSWECASY